MSESLPHVSQTALFQGADDEEDSDASSDAMDDDDSGTDHIVTKSSTQLQRCERQGSMNSSLPDTFQTSHLLFYERFKAYQDYMLGNNKGTPICNINL